MPIAFWGRRRRGVGAPSPLVRQPRPPPLVRTQNLPPVPLNAAFPDVERRPVDAEPAVAVRGYARDLLDDASLVRATTRSASTGSVDREARARRGPTTRPTPQAIAHHAASTAAIVSSTLIQIRHRQ